MVNSWEGVNDFVTKNRIPQKREKEKGVKNMYYVIHVKDPFTTEN